MDFALLTQTGSPQKSYAKPLSRLHYARAIEVQAEYLASRVEVTLQTLSVNGDWGRVGRVVSVEYGPELEVDSISIRRRELELGSGEFVNGSPALVLTRLYASTCQ